MKHPIVLSIVLLTWILSPGGLTCTGKNSNTKTRAPDFMLHSIDGTRCYLNQYQGNLVLLNFWSIHCIPCLVEMPKMQLLADSLIPKGVTFIGICNDPGEEGYVAALLKKLGVTYTNLIDKKKIVTQKYSVTTLPATFIIDYTGVIRYHQVGYDEQYLAKYHNILEMILHEKKTKKF